MSSVAQHKGHADRVGSPDNLLYTHLKGCQRSLPSTAFHEYATSCVDNHWQCGRKRLDSNCFESRLKITKVQTRLVLAKDRNDGTRREKHANTQSVCPWWLKPHTRAQSPLFQRSLAETLCSQRQRADKTCMRPPHALSSDRQWRSKVVQFGLGARWKLTTSASTRSSSMSCGRCEAGARPGPQIVNKVVCEVLSHTGIKATSPEAINLENQCWEQGSPKVTILKKGFECSSHKVVLCHSCVAHCAQVFAEVLSKSSSARAHQALAPAVDVKLFWQCWRQWCRQRYTNPAKRKQSLSRLAIIMTTLVDALQKAKNQRVDHHRSSIVVKPSLPKISRLSHTTGQFRAHGSKIWK